MTSLLSGLVAYPAEPSDIGQTIIRGLEKLHLEPKFRKLTSWEENDIPGRFIATEVLRRIESGKVFVADITRLNFNVIFEIGFAIGVKKRVILLRNEILKTEDDLIRQIGIFDTLGYVPYRDADSLQSVLSDISDFNPIAVDLTNKSTTTPVYILLPQKKGEAETHLVSRLKKTLMPFRSYDPEEHGRLSALEAIENVANSHGVIIPFLPSHYVEAEIHNIRGAFVAGLAHGMDRIMLLLQSGDDPIPIDYRDLVRRFKFLDQIDEFLTGFAPLITESLFRKQPSVVDQPTSFLSQLTLGASSAENEFIELGKYYIETDEFRRTLRGEVQIVLGRKGAGKTAMFYQIRDRLRGDKSNIILDLKPEGFQLLKFKERVLDYLEEGTREHTITAFWEYLLMLEICHKLLQNDKSLHLRDHKIYPYYQNLASTYAADEYISEGDFAERMLNLTQRISVDFDAIRGNDDVRHRMSNDEITQLIYKHDIPALRSQLSKYLMFKKSLWILIDNIDKGWPPHGVTSEDVLTLRCLIDAMFKLKRAFQSQNIITNCVVFIRNDVYENLVDATPDRGKIAHILVDWTDPQLLLELLRRRFLSSGIKNNPPFENIWRALCVSHIGLEESSHYMIDRCLMRPRALIEFIKYCRGHAVNLGKQKIGVKDIEQGEEQYSTQLVNDICYEIQDICPPAKDILYEFIECPSELDNTGMRSILKKATSNSNEQDRIIDLLLWYGVIGFLRDDGKPTFIYSVRYDTRRLKALLKKRDIDSITYVINPAFWKGLEIKT